MPGLKQKIWTALIAIGTLAAGAVGVIQLYEYIFPKRTATFESRIFLSQSPFSEANDLVRFALENETKIVNLAVTFVKPPFASLELGVLVGCPGQFLVPPYLSGETGAFQTTWVYLLDGGQDTLVENCRLSTLIGEAAGDLPLGNPNPVFKMNFEFPGDLEHHLVIYEEQGTLFYEYNGFFRVQTNQSGEDGLVLFRPVSASEAQASL